MLPPSQWRTTAGLIAQLNEAPKYRREPRANKLSAFEAALRQALT